MFQPAHRKIPAVVLFPSRVDLQWRRPFPKANCSQPRLSPRQNYSQPAPTVRKALRSLPAPLMNNFGNGISESRVERDRSALADPKGSAGGRWQRRISERDLQPTNDEALAREDHASVRGVLHRDGLESPHASAHVHSDAPRRTKSLIRNCPGTTDSAGKPPADASQTPGVVNRKLSVVRNIPTANAPPAAAARVENGRTASIVRFVRCGNGLGG